VYSTWLYLDNNLQPKLATRDVYQQPGAHKFCAQGCWPHGQHMASYAQNELFSYFIHSKIILTKLGIIAK